MKRRTHNSDGADPSTDSADALRSKVPHLKAVIFAITLIVAVIICFWLYGSKSTEAEYFAFSPPIGMRVQIQSYTGDHEEVVIPRWAWVTYTTEHWLGGKFHPLHRNQRDPRAGAGHRHRFLVLQKLRALEID